MTSIRYYKPELDLLRLCAFLFVFFTHRLDLAPIDPAQYYWGHHISLVGVFGVPLFFFLSAFLITELLTKEQDQFGKISVKSFYIRRILRIWPLYFTFFFGMVLVTQFSDKLLLLMNGFRLTLLIRFGAFLLKNNFTFYFH
jgi:peptidoglycan/LPS O-acetylase OafA/YrhL